MWSLKVVYLQRTQLNFRYVSVLNDERTSETEGKQRKGTYHFLSWTFFAFVPV
jgi:hypothetical protein